MNAVDQYTLLRGFGQKLDQQKDLLVHLQRQQRDRQQPPRPNHQFFALAMASLHKLRGHHQLADALLQRAAVNPAQLTVAGWAAELASSPVGGLLLAIQKQSAYAALAARTQAFSIDDEALPKIVVGGEINASFIAEGQPIAVTKSVLSPLSLSPRKLAALVTLSGELLDYGVNVAATLRQLMSAGISSTLDAAFFSNAAATTAAPAGVLAGLVAVTPSAATPPSEAARSDLRALVAALTAPTDPVFITSPARAVFLATILPSDFGYPVLSSSAVPASRLIAVDAGGLVAAHGTEPRFRASRDATLHEEDTTPLPIASPGAPATVAAPSRSLFQTDAVAIRAILTVA